MSKSLLQSWLESQALLGIEPQIILVLRPKHDEFAVEIFGGATVYVRRNSKGMLQIQYDAGKKKL